MQQVFTYPLSFPHSWPESRAAVNVSFETICSPSSHRANEFESEQANDAADVEELSQGQDQAQNEGYGDAAV